MKNNIFNIKGFRKSQKAISNDLARNLVKHIVTSDTSDDKIYGKNGEIRGWVLGSLTQLSKRKPWGNNNIKSTFGFQK
jgi:hypothetical protein